MVMGAGLLPRKMEGLGDTVGAMDAALRGVRDGYNHARARLCLAINARCSVLAKIPPEILAVIFEETCAAYHGGGLPRQPSRNVTA